jgi:Family of unknown function (DUF5675)
LEDVVRPKDAAKVYGKTAIPAGVYPVIISYSNSFKCMMPEVLNVPGYLGIRVHVGNSAIETDGCILVGKSKSKDFIAESRVTYNKLFATLHDAHQRGEKMTVTVEDTQPSPLEPAKAAKTTKTK